MTNHPACICEPSDCARDDCPIHGMLPVPEPKDTT